MGSVSDSGSLLKSGSGSLLKSGSSSMSAPLSVVVEASNASTKQELIALLGIDPELCGDDPSDRGLIFAYARWKAIDEAYKKAQSMTWNGSKPTYTTIIGLFLSTSMFYSHYKKYFIRVMKYPEMVEWLEERPDGPSNMDIWGKEKAYYSFTDLAKWLEEAATRGLEDSSDDGRRKGKKKEVEKKGKKGVEKKKGELKEDGKSHHKGKSKVKKSSTSKK
jgi:hypothetical protein